MREYLSKISFTTIILVYLFFCGTIYLLSFWATFDFDISSYIELLDVPKSFIYPVVTGIGVGLISGLINLVGLTVDNAEENEKKDKELLPKLKELPTKVIVLRIIRDYSFWSFLIILLSFLFYEPRRLWVFEIGGSVLVILGTVQILRMKDWVQSRTVRLFLAIVICFIPIFSFTSAKQRAIRIWKNQEYQTVSKFVADGGFFYKDDVISKKVIGKLGSNLFLTDTSNSCIIILDLRRVGLIEYAFHTSDSAK